MSKKNDGVATKTFTYIYTRRSTKEKYARTNGQIYSKYEGEELQEIWINDGKFNPSSVNSEDSRRILARESWESEYHKYRHKKISKEKYDKHIKKMGFTPVHIEGECDDQNKK